MRATPTAGVRARRQERTMPLFEDPAKEAEIQSALDRLVLDWPDTARGRMFGAWAYRARGVLFAMVAGDGVVLTKLTPSEREDAIQNWGARAFVGRGRAVPGWMAFTLESAADLDRLEMLVRAAYRNACEEAG
jgi:hypothetical protein